MTTRPTPTRWPKPISRSQLASLLANPYYIGTVRYAGVEYEGRHEHLIDGRTFARVQAVLSAYNHAAEKDRKHHHYLKGSLFCGRCGSRMSLIHAKGNGGTYPYFFCIARMRGTGCDQPYVPVELVERAVEGAYAQVRVPREHADLVRTKLDEALAGMRDQAEQEAARQRRRLAKLTAEREKLLHAYYAGAVPVDLLRQEQDPACERDLTSRAPPRNRRAVLWRRAGDARQGARSPHQLRARLLQGARAPAPPVEPSAL